MGYGVQRCKNCGMRNEAAVATEDSAWRRTAFVARVENLGWMARASLEWAIESQAVECGKVRLCSLNGRKIVEGAARGHRGLQNARPTKGNRFDMSLAGNEFENSALRSGSLRAFFKQSAAPVWRFRPSRAGFRACWFTVLS